MPLTYDHRHTVSLEETNLVGNVYFTHYLRWQGHCRERFLADKAPATLAALRTDLALLTLSCACEYLGELTGGDTVELRMTLTELADNTVGMAFDYYRLGTALPRLVARGAQRIACMRRAPSGLEPVAVPEELHGALSPYLTGPRP